MLDIWNAPKIASVKFMPNSKESLFGGGGSTFSHHVKLFSLLTVYTLLCSHQRGAFMCVLLCRQAGRRELPQKVEQEGLREETGGRDGNICDSLHWEYTEVDP